MFDLLVLGGGIAGMTAAATTVRGGGSAMVVEKGPLLGGSGQYAGYIWTAPDHDVMDRVNPGGDLGLKRALVDDFDDAVQWIGSLGVSCGKRVPVIGYGRGHRFDTAHYVDGCRHVVRENGVIVTEASARRLLLDDGVVRGAEIGLADGSARTVEATATLLATGGFQADPELRARYLHEQARDVELRSNPFSSGDGLRLAIEAGAAIGSEGAGFYGHLIPSGVALEPELFVDITLYYSEHAALFNLAGERFVDETAADHLTAMALLDQPEARGLLVTDARGYREWITGAYVEGADSLDKFALARSRGARCVVADSASDFAEMPAEWGYDGPKIAEELGRLARGESAGPGRESDPRALDEPPYYVVEARPAVTFPFTGVRIDPRARVLSSSGAPIPGLFAAGADIGGLYERAYAGGLAPAIVFGRRAAAGSLVN
ncbi:flavocytochrome c [Saccharopolyspora gloriosae]|uniref:Succinate dehydrogenase/fumarate reductase flavoprotein subunit n=1 Tax=Saccharopolyspora gloriosae TaxID=455344 RepID=A0A840NIL7_9PSEU|nr:FAD-binding protein [Saccharopolyspora gloriosae]MBB5070138.1 succinate dehydrogenase/fumarate reductase flavoprotein subunit [Saccharopolyspora gloriosae]